jgi:recombinational DNA repair ATPase RecF
MPVLSSRIADRVERAVAQRNLAVKASQDIEPQHGDGIDQHLAELGYAIATDRKRQSASDREECGNANVSEYSR